ncbi:MAG: 6-carboxytetrahydropterin synthase, partial [Kiritimatiellaceae bacterium]|nr:6-carboxytetrahydropterin synthase [Kiritimatiellaceae bacterium]
MEIFKTFRFDSAHQLTGVPPTHRCANMHGHGYELTVYLRGPVDPVTGFVLDFGDLATVCDPLIKQLDP